MKTHTTNYFNAFVEVAEDCPAAKGESPPAKGDEKTVANIQCDTINRSTYCFTSDEV